MELKWFGAVLVVAGCGSCGFILAGACRREERLLQLLLEALEYMTMELSCRVTPLPDLCAAVSAKTGLNIREYFGRLADLLESQVAPDASQCAQIALLKCGRLPKRTMQALQRLSAGLGSFDYESQLQHIRSVEEYCRSELDSLHRGLDNKLRTYRTLGLCAGAALVVFLV